MTCWRLLIFIKLQKSGRCFTDKTPAPNNLVKSAVGSRHEGPCDCTEPHWLPWDLESHRIHLCGSVPKMKTWLNKWRPGKRDKVMGLDATVFGCPTLRHQRSEFQKCWSLLGPIDFTCSCELSALLKNHTLRLTWDLMMLKSYALSTRVNFIVHVYKY